MNRLYKNYVCWNSIIDCYYDNNNLLRLKIDSLNDDLELLDRESISLNASTNSSSSSYKNIFTVSNTNDRKICNTCLRDLRNVRKNSVNKLPK